MQLWGSILGPITSSVPEACQWTLLYLYCSSHRFLIHRGVWYNILFSSVTVTVVGGKLRKFLTLGNLLWLS